MVIILKILTASRKFYHEIFILEQSSRNHESFLPRKFGAIWYKYGVIQKLHLNTNMDPSTL